MRKNKGLCVVCDVAEGEHCHHVVFQQYGGGDEYDNLVPLCKVCHWYVHNFARKLVQDGLIRLFGIEKLCKVVLREVRLRMKRYNYISQYFPDAEFESYTGTLSGIYFDDHPFPEGTIAKFYRDVRVKDMI